MENEAVDVLAPVVKNVVDGAVQDLMSRTVKRTRVRYAVKTVSGADVPDHIMAHYNDLLT